MIKYLERWKRNLFSQFGVIRELTNPFDIDSSINNISKQDPSTSITFPDYDLDSIKMLHSDPLVIKLRIVNVIVSRVLVDGGSSYDIIF